jgi:hypothetical protein
MSEPSTLTCIRCLQPLNIQCNLSRDVLDGLKHPNSSVTVYQYALPGQSQVTPALCQPCHSSLTAPREGNPSRSEGPSEPCFASGQPFAEQRAPYPSTALCYVCETVPIQKRYEFLVSFGYMGLNVYTLLCSAKCRARHEIFARQDFRDNGGHLQMINDPQLAAEITAEILRLQSSTG